MSSYDKNNALGEKVFVRNRKARHEFHIEDTFEAGLVLTGSEVKSIRQSSASLNEAYVAVHGEEVFLVGAHVAEWPYSHIRNHVPTRRRKLLLHKREIVRLKVKVKERGYTLVPLALYSKQGRIKLQVGLARGKRKYDKRESIKRKDQLREQAQERAWERRKGVNQGI